MRTYARASQTWTASTSCRKHSSATTSELGMFSRLCFELRRPRDFNNATFVRVVAAPAQYNGLDGRVWRYGERRYVVVLEGSRNNIATYQAAVEYITPGLGTVGGFQTTHHHVTRAFPPFSGVQLYNMQVNLPLMYNVSP